MKRMILTAIGLAASSGGLAQSAPPTDSRGIAVVSAPSSAPAGVNTVATVAPGATVVVSPDPSAAFAPVAATGKVPPCSKTVTDRCKQTYERQGR